MRIHRRRLQNGWKWLLVLTLAILCAPAGVSLSVADDAPASDKLVETKTGANDDVAAAPLSATPGSLDELLEIQRRVQDVLKRATPATVAVQVGAAMGTGIVVSEDGFVLCAGHVCGEADRRAMFIFPDGRRVWGKTLGINRGMDSSLLKITDEGPWPFVEMGHSTDLTPGTWAVAIGHPGGYQSDRSPVVRLGRVIEYDPIAIHTDCALASGDSGGPLLDLSGRVIGIHSRISARPTDNYHVPIDTYRKTWDRLEKGDVWGTELGSGGAWLGIQGGPSEEGCRVANVFADSPAEKGGLEEGDVITRLGKRPIDNLRGLAAVLRREEPGSEITLTVLRGEETLDIIVVLGQRE